MQVDMMMKRQFVTEYMKLHPLPLRMTKYVIILNTKNGVDRMVSKLKDGFVHSFTGSSEGWQYQVHAKFARTETRGYQRHG